MAGTTDHYGLSTMGPGDKFSADGYKHVDADRDFIDLLLWLGAESHTHTGDTGSLEEPDTAPVLELNTTGGVIPAGTRVYYKYTYVSERGEESVASPEAYIDTPAAVVSPSAPVLDYATTGGILLPGTYYYAFSAYVGTSTTETLVTNQAVITIQPGTATNTVTITLPSLPSGADGFVIYRRKPGQTKLFYLDTVDMSVATPPTTYEDDGSVTEDCDRGVPRVNTTNASNTVDITLPGATPAVPDGYTWKIYRTYVADTWSISLLHHVVENIAEGDPTITPTYEDVGASTTEGTFPLVQRLIGSPSKINLTDGAEVQGILPISMVEGGGGGGGGGFLVVAAADSDAIFTASANYVCDGVADEIEINQAIDALDAIGGMILLAPGTYNIGASIEFDDGNIHFKGATTGFGDTPEVSILRNQTASNFPAFAVTSTSDSHRIEDVYVYDNDLYANADALFAINATVASTVTLCRVVAYNDQTNGNVFEFLDDGQYLYAYDCDLQSDGHVIYSPPGRDGITIRGEGSYLYSISADAIHLETMTGSLELSNIKDGGSAGNAVYVDASGGGSVDVSINNLRADASNNDIAIHLIGITVPVYIDSPIIHTCTSSGIKIDTCTAGGSIVNPMIGDGQGNGVNHHGIWLLNADNFVINGGYVMNASLGTDNTYSGILIDGDSDSNTINGTRIGTDGAGNLPLYGIRIDDSTCNNNFITNVNLLGSCKTNGNEISDAGTNTRGHEVFQIAAGDETTAITLGTAKTTWRMPYAFVVTKVRASLTTQSSSGNPTFDIMEGGSTILSTKLSIDSGETTSTTATTAAVISDPYLADDAEMRIDVVTSAGTGAAGPKISIYGWRV